MTGQTLTAKVLRAHGVEDVTPGSYGLLDVDLLMLNDVSGAVALKEFARMGAARVFDPAKVACVADHFWPAKDIRSAHQVRLLREFADAQGIEDYWETGATVDSGIEHALLAEQGRVLPGRVVVGGDSHTCTAGALGAFGTGVGSTDVAAVLALGQLWIRVPEAHRVTFVGTPGKYVMGKDLALALLRHGGVSGSTYASVEYAGEALARTSVDDRMALCNMAVEAGAKTGMVAADDVTLDWLQPRLGHRPDAVRADPDAAYDREVTIDVADMPPLIAAPWSPGNVRTVDEVGPGVRVHQVYVGNCANGTISDLRALATVMRGRQVAKGTRLVVVPATQRTYRQALAEGVVATLLDAGAMLSPPTCGACFGGHTGILDDGEVAVATTNRNFVGRMGHPGSSVYLANAWVAGAAAVTGELTDPAVLA
ncbi:3-isopropylmalate dehydratase large subunit [Actinoplanes sp. TRM 88003]|uniref:3-isopropylmalate dehydratase large subunit n=1 Tax=Paractinoplanes aksuensis TaxID=2939490 RepID=A0ABT1DE60_9ACTN|nr:3-isopropylmalate dehydratase large subunit [Actinoplanes aksuensis]MCO8269104.1 3-isopropylmalate dehydratase large subunit [Actinoplanes aksuensis]